MSKKELKPATSLAELKRKYETTTNPVTRSVYRDIIANRVARPKEKSDDTHKDQL